MRRLCQCLVQGVLCLSLAVMPALGLAACMSGGPADPGSNVQVLVPPEDADSASLWSAPLGVHLPSGYQIVSALSDTRGMRQVDYYFHFKFSTKEASYARFLQESNLQQTRTLLTGEGASRWVSHGGPRPISTPDSVLIELRRIGSQGIAVSIGYQLLASVGIDAVDLFVSPS